METSTLEHGSVLLAIDDSTATWKAVDYVAGLAKTKQAVCVHLLHAAAYPPALQESRGAEDPNEEEQVEKDLERKQRRLRVVSARTSTKRERSSREPVQLTKKWNPTCLRWRIVRI